MRSGYMVVDCRNGHIDMLLAGPGESVTLGEVADGLHVVKLKKFLKRWPKILPITIRRMPGVINSSPDIDDFMQWIKQQKREND